MLGAELRQPKWWEGDPRVTEHQSPCGCRLPVGAGPDLTPVSTPTRPWLRAASGPQGCHTDCVPEQAPGAPGRYVPPEAAAGLQSPSGSPPSGPPANPALPPFRTRGPPCPTEPQPHPTKPPLLPALVAPAALSAPSSFEHLLGQTQTRQLHCHRASVSPVGETVGAKQ